MLSFGLTHAVPFSPRLILTHTHTHNVNIYITNKQTRLQKQRGAPCFLPPSPSLP